MKKILEFSLFLDSEKNKNWHFVSWEEVCAIYECHYHNEVSPFSFDYKFKGKKYGLLFNEYSPMAIGIASPLFKILQKHTKSNLLFINHKGAIEEVSKQQYTDSKNDFFLFNSVTKKREWMTYIGHESICITIGGNYDLIDELLNCKELEVLECTPLIRVDWHSDKINT